MSLFDNTIDAVKCLTKFVFDHHQLPYSIRVWEVLGLILAHCSPTTTSTYVRLKSLVQRQGLCTFAAVN